MKIVKFYRTSILQSNAAPLLLISRDIFNISLALSVINQFSLAWRYNISIISALTVVLHYINPLSDSVALI